MTIVTITVVDNSNPVEVQAWFDANPTVSLVDLIKDGNLFYVVYQ